MKTNAPKDNDAVLGNNNPTPSNAAVLGGLSGVKEKLNHAAAEVRSAALEEALKYGTDATLLIVEALTDDSEIVKRKAFLLLSKIETSNAIASTIESFFPLCKYDFENWLNVKSGDQYAGSRISGKTCPTANWLCNIYDTNDIEVCMDAIILNGHIIDTPDWMRTFEREVGKKRQTSGYCKVEEALDIICSI